MKKRKLLTIGIPFVVSFLFSFVLIGTTEPAQTFTIWQATVLTLCLFLLYALGYFVHWLESEYVPTRYF